MQQNIGYRCLQGQNKNQHNIDKNNENTKLIKQTNNNNQVGGRNYCNNNSNNKTKCKLQKQALNNILKPSSQTDKSERKLSQHDGQKGAKKILDVNKQPYHTTNEKVKNYVFQQRQKQIQKVQSIPSRIISKSMVAFKTSPSPCITKSAKKKFSCKISETTFSNKVQAHQRHRKANMKCYSEKRVVSQKYLQKKALINTKFQWLGKYLQQNGYCQAKPNEIQRTTTEKQENHSKQNINFFFNICTFSNHHHAQNQDDNSFQQISCTCTQCTQFIKLSQNKPAQQSEQFKQRQTQLIFNSSFSNLKTRCSVFKRQDQYSIKNRCFQKNTSEKWNLKFNKNQNQKEGLTQSTFKPWAKVLQQSEKQQLLSKIALYENGCDGIDPKVNNFTQQQKQISINLQQHQQNTKCRSQNLQDFCLSIQSGQAVQQKQNNKNYPKVLVARRDAQSRMTVEGNHYLLKKEVKNENLLRNGQKQNSSSSFSHMPCRTKAARHQLKYPSQRKHSAELKYKFRKNVSYYKSIGETSNQDIQNRNKKVIGYKSNLKVKRLKIQENTPPTQFQTSALNSQCFNNSDEPLDKRYSNNCSIKNRKKQYFYNSKQARPSGKRCFGSQFMQNCKVQRARDEIKVEPWNLNIDQQDYIGNEQNVKPATEGHVQKHRPNVLSKNCSGQFKIR